MKRVVITGMGVVSPIGNSVEEFWSNIKANKHGFSYVDDIVSPDFDVRIAARVYGRDPAWVRAGIIAGWLPIGEATRNGRRVTDLKEMSSKYGRINYYISPKLLFEQTGYEWRGEK